MKALTLPKQVQVAVIPKPTKAEIVQAMVRLHIEKHEADVKEKVALRASLSEEAEKLIQEFFAEKVKTLKGVVGLGQRDFDYKDGSRIYKDEVDNVKIVFYLDESLPKSIKQLLLRIHEIPTSFRDPDPKQLKQKMALKLEGIGTESERIESLLTDPESRKGLEKMLSVIGM